MEYISEYNDQIRNIFINWWLIRATYVVDGRYFGHFLVAH